MKYPPDLTTRAEQQNLALVTIEVTGDPCSPNEIGTQRIQFAFGQDETHCLMGFMRAIRSGKAPLVAFTDAFPREEPVIPKNKTLSVTDLFPDRVQ